MKIQHLIAPASLPNPMDCGIISRSASLSVLSYNVLLPNSIDGWWNYKMYSPTLFNTNGNSVIDNQDQNNMDIEIDVEEMMNQIHKISSWEYRQELIKQKIRQINADVVCLQEVSPKSFEMDFAFMKDNLGYNGVELFKKGRFRPATFWKTDRCTLIGPPVHKDRTLLTVFELNEDIDADNNTDNNTDNDADNDADTSKVEGKKNTNEGYGEEQEDKVQWHVLNCHLQAGLQAQRRLRQIEDGVKASCRVANQYYTSKQNEYQQKLQRYKKNNKKKQQRNKNKTEDFNHNESTNISANVRPKPLSKNLTPSPHLIICGDFNGDFDSAAVRFLEDGKITPEFCEDGINPSSKVRHLPAGIPKPSYLLDVPSASTSSIDNNEENVCRNAPPTMIVSELISNMVHPDSLESKPMLSNQVLERLERIYNRYASAPIISDPDETSKAGTIKKQMNVQDVERWLCTINGKVGRGSEFRAAAAEMGWTPPQTPTPSKNEKENESGAESSNEERPPIVLPPNGILSLSSFQKVYQLELQSGKYWGIAHDLAVMDEPLSDAGLYKARLDRMFCTSNIRPYAVIDTLCEIPCPNAIEPSDHLPIAASFTLN